jgi:hypothetical protein
MSKEPFHNEASQSERYAVIVSESRQKNTLLSHTHDADEMGGRYKAVHEQTVVGRDPVNYPAAGAWSMTQLPDEPGLGYEINSQEAVGTEAEIRASLGGASFPAAQSEDGAAACPAPPRSPHSPQALVRGKRDAGSDHSPSGSQRLSTFKRRI